jgi:toxin ParE1/3/4
MKTTIWADTALQDFAAIDDWYAGKDVDFANRVAIAAVQAARRLAEFPEIGEQIGADLRKWTVPGTDYRLIYRVDGHAVRILRVRHAREDWRGLP